MFMDSGTNGWCLSSPAGVERSLMVYLSVQDGPTRGTGCPCRVARHYHPGGAGLQKQKRLPVSTGEPPLRG
jgi:hypothetical protein